MRPLSTKPIAIAPKEQNLGRLSDHGTAHCLVVEPVRGIAVQDDHRRGLDLGERRQEVDPWIAAQTQIGIDPMESAIRAGRGGETQDSGSQFGWRLRAGPERVALRVEQSDGAEGVGADELRQSGLELLSGFGVTLAPVPVEPGQEGATANEVGILLALPQPALELLLLERGHGQQACLVVGVLVMVVVEDGAGCQDSQHAGDDQEGQPVEPVGWGLGSLDIDHDLWMPGWTGAKLARRADLLGLVEMTRTSA